MLIVSVVALPIRVGAQQESSLQISPAIIDVGTLPGTSTQRTITLTNLSLQPIAVASSTRSLSPEDELIDQLAADRYDASKWVELSETDVLIAPQNSREITVNVSIPKNAVPGGHYALSVFKILSATEPDGSGVSITPEAGAVILVNVPGNATESVVVESQPINRLIFGDKFQINSFVRNTGNTHVTPIITTEIIDKNGKVVDKVTEPIQLLLPNTKRSIAAIFTKNSVRPGRYSARTTVSFGTPTKSVAGNSKQLLLLPQLSTLLSLAIFVVIAAKVIRKYKKSIITILKANVNKATKFY